MSDPIASLEDFLASQLAMLGSGPEPGMSDGSGPKLHDALGRFDPDGGFSKTSADFFLSTTDVRSEKFSQTWPASGTMRRGSVSPLPTWAPPTGGNASGSSPDAWPTPQEDDANNVTRESGQYQSTTRAAQQWATPASRDYKDGATRVGPRPDGRPRLDTTDRQAMSFALGETLSLFGERTAPSDSSPVTPWSTPNLPSGGRAIPEGTEQRGRSLYSKDGRKVQLDPNNEAKAWATPRAEDSECSGERVSRGTADTLTSQTARATGQRAAYNPRFGEWLLGMPVDWLDVPVFEATKPSRGRRPKPTTPAPEAGTPHGRS